MAAVLACGSGAVLSHRSAAALWGMRPSERKIVDVASPGRRGRGVDGIDAHRNGRLGPADATAVAGIPTTSPARTLLDLASLINDDGLLRAIDRSERLRIFDLNGLSEVTARATGHPGVRSLQAALAGWGTGSDLTRSELEERFLALCESAGISRPQVNSLIEVEGGPIEVDFAWPAARVAVEADGFRFHSTARAFEADRLRDQRLTLAGWRVVRCTWRQVTREPAELAATIQRLLEG